MMNENPSLSWFSRSGEDFDVVFSSRIRLSRNLSDCKFCSMMSISEQNFVDREVLKTFELQNNPFRPHKLGEFSALERHILIERHLISQNFSLNPDHYCFFNQDQSLSGMINGIDHLRFSSIFSGHSLNQAWETILNFDKKLEETLPMSASPELGYLNPELLNCGTGMKASVLFHLPGLSRLDLLDKTFESMTRIGLDIKGIVGDKPDSGGDLYQISNPFGLGLSEEKIIANLTDVALHLISIERQARKNLYDSNRIELEDQVYRAYGILSEARQITYEEALTHLQNVRLGVSLNILDIPLSLVTDLVYLIQNAHVQKEMDSAETVFDSSRINYKRASIIRDRLSEKALQEADDV